MYVVCYWWDDNPADSTRDMFVVAVETIILVVDRDVVKGDGGGQEPEPWLTSPILPCHQTLHTQPSVMCNIIIHLKSVYSTE